MPRWQAALAITATMAAGGIFWLVLLPAIGAGLRALFHLVFG